MHSKHCNPALIINLMDISSRSHNKALHHFMPSGCLIKIQSHHILISVSHTIIPPIRRKWNWKFQSPTISSSTQTLNFVVVVNSVQKMFKSGYCLLIEDFSSSKIFLDKAKCPLHPNSHIIPFYSSLRISIHLPPSITHTHSHFVAWSEAISIMNK